MNDYENQTRKNKFEKRRKITKSISILLVLSVVLVISLIGAFIFGGGSDDTVDGTSQEQSENNTSNNSEDLTIVEDTDKQTEEEQSPEQPPEESPNETKDSDDSNKEDEQEIEQVEPSDDNVSEAYTANWDPVGTKQEGSHIVNYSEGSQDRIEMRKAILTATGLSENDYHEWWIGNGGDQKVIATVSDKEQTEIYRVYLSWIDNEGWQPTKVEVLIENDWKKYQ